MTDLIVGFPQGLRSSTSGTRRTNTVRFATKSSILFFEREIDSRNELWYQDKDYKAMKRANVREAQNAHKIYQELATLSDVNSTESAKELIDSYTDLTTGLENKVTSYILKKTLIADRTIHRNAVLNEQDKQYQTGVNDPDELAFVSCTYSSWSTRKAIKIGIVHSNR